VTHLNLSHNRISDRCVYMRPLAGSMQHAEHLAVQRCTTAGTASLMSCLLWQCTACPTSGVPSVVMTVLILRHDSVAACVTSRYVCSRRVSQD
jgi:hypothetical protein